MSAGGGFGSGVEVCLVVRSMAAEELELGRDVRLVKLADGGQEGEGAGKGINGFLNWARCLEGKQPWSRGGGKVAGGR